MHLPPEHVEPYTFPNEHAREHFEFFNALNHPHFGLVAQVDVSAWRASAKTAGTTFNRYAVHRLTRAANGVPTLRRRVRAGQVVEHRTLHPNYTVSTAGGEGFSFCTVPYADDLAAFAKTAAAVEAEVAAAPNFEVEADRDDFLFMSAIPWVHFTGIQHAMDYHPTDSVPRITWGKVVPDPQNSGRLLMPVTIQAHHAVADGRALGAFYEALG